MPDWFILLAPLLVLPVILLFVFTGCTLDHTALRSFTTCTIALNFDPSDIGMHSSALQVSFTLAGSPDDGTLVSLPSSGSIRVPIPHNSTMGRVVWGHDLSSGADLSHPWPTTLDPGGSTVLVQGTLIVTCTVTVDGMSTQPPSLNTPPISTRLIGREVQFSLGRVGTHFFLYDLTNDTVASDPTAPPGGTVQVSNHVPMSTIAPPTCSLELYTTVTDANFTLSLQSFRQVRDGAGGWTCELDMLGTPAGTVWLATCAADVSIGGTTYSCGCAHRVFWQSSGANTVHFELVGGGPPTMPVRLQPAPAP
jgi:hypothetical protein